jgi:hypothetical protein
MEHIELKNLVEKCVKGEIQIGKPIMLTSRNRTETTMVSFLNHLMKYNGIKPESLFSFYFNTLNMFNKIFRTLMKQSKSFDSYVQHIKKEWDVEEHILCEEVMKLGESKQTIEELLENMNILCRQFRELNGRVRTNNMTEVIVDDEMVDGMDEFLEKVGGLSGEIESISGILDKISEHVDRVNMVVLLDLSMKGKAMYLEFSGVDNDMKIPENINISFLNYVYIINLIKKHIVYYRRIVSKVRDISDNMGKYVEKSKESIQGKDELFMMNKQQTDINNYLDSLETDIGDVDVDVDVESEIGDEE